MNKTLCNFAITKVLCHFRSFYSMMRGQMGTMYSSLVESALGPQAQLSVASVYTAGFLNPTPQPPRYVALVRAESGQAWHGMNRVS